MRLVLLSLLLTINIVLGESTNSIDKKLIHQAFSNFNQESFDQLISKTGTNWTGQNQKTLLHFSARYGYYNASKALIDKDPQLINVTNKYHMFPLHFAAWKGHCDIVKMLLLNGADVNSLAKFTDDSPTTPPSASALYLAAMNGSVGCVRILLDNGADINNQDRYGFTALHVASSNGNYAVIKLLLEKGADATIKTNDDKTALDIAAENYKK